MNYLIFGGGGFIGTHLAKYLTDKGVTNIYNFDINEKENSFSNYTFCDVRNPINISIPDLSSSIIFNLAAVHITPGHAEQDYFKTNITGAENMCVFARENNINTIVFTSSIACYGASEELKTEEALTMPGAAYGMSKLVAEYIHKIWQAEDPVKRKLIIVRPGAVFGKNEGGNFTRLYKSLKSGHFFYPGRKDTIKAAIYVKDVVRILYEAAVAEKAETVILNLTFFPAPTIEKICKTIARVTMLKEPKIVLPTELLKLAAGMFYNTGKILGKNFYGIHPDRVKKLMVSTNISGEKLSNTPYRLKYNLKEAIEDWYNESSRSGLN